MLRLSWLTGPIFDKELRVSSRRRRNYVLRFAYLAFLTLFVVLVWFATVTSSRSAAFGISRMSEAGKTIILTIIWFQFITTQFIAIIMLSTAISDEIYHRTLGVLMTTPVNSFQIVMGKLFSKLLQLILLLAISLPILAIIRVFGGVPWGFVISSLCIILSAVIFAGSLSLFFSINGRRSYAIILRTLLTLGVIYAFIPTILGLLLHDVVAERILFPILLYANPFAALQFNTITMMSPGMPMGIPFSLYWPAHCLIMLGASVLLLGLAVKIVRKVALRQAVGELNPTSKRKRRFRKAQTDGTEPDVEQQESTSPIREVKGSPIIWKELRAPFIQGGRTKSIIGLIIAIIALLITYGACIKENALDDQDTHIVYTIIFVIMGLVSTAVLSANTITSEKETRSWPILLATPLDDWNILLGKAVGVFRRCLPIWLFLAGHVLLFVLIRFIHPIAVIHLTMLVAWCVVFLSGSGLYFSACFKRTTSAVVANLALVLAFWLVTPLLLGLISEITNNHDLLELNMSVNPVVQAGVIMEGAGGTRNAGKELSRLDYDWPQGSYWGNFGPTTIILFFTMLSYMLLGFLFAWRAKCRFRRNIF